DFVKGVGYELKSSEGTVFHHLHEGARAVDDPETFAAFIHGSLQYIDNKTQEAADFWHRNKHQIPAIASSDITKLCCKETETRTPLEADESGTRWGNQFDFEQGIIAMNMQTKDKKTTQKGPKANPVRLDESDDDLTQLIALITRQDQEKTPN